MRIVILAGGSGSRLWPMSRSSIPKQFCKLTSNKTMLEETLDRFNNFPEDKKFISKFVPKTFGNGLDKFLSKNDEFSLFNSLNDFLKEEFNIENIEIIDDEKTNAIPTKPKIIME